MEKTVNNKVEGLTLREVLQQHPELLELPEFEASEYGNSGENIFEMISKYLDGVNLIAERNNRDEKTAVDFKIINPKTKEVIAYCDMEADYTGAFLDDGCFKYWQINIPIEKEKHFFRDKPFFYIKYSKDFKWCFVLDGWAVRENFEKKSFPCNMGGIIEERLMNTLNSSFAFNRKIPYGIHRCNVQDWLRAVAFFMNKRYSQLKLDFENEKKD